MKKVFCFNNCACHVFQTNLVLVWFQCCPSYLSRKKGIAGTFLSLGLRPRLQKIFPRFPFFYFGNLDNTSIRRGQICPQTWQHNYRNKILFPVWDLQVLKNHEVIWKKPLRLKHTFFQEIKTMIVCKFWTLPPTEAVAEDFFAWS